MFLSAVWMETVLHMQELLYGSLEIFHYTWGHANLFACKRRETIYFFKLVGLVVPNLHKERMRSKALKGASSVKMESIDEISLLYDWHENF